MVLANCSPEDVRKAIGLESDDATDSVLEHYIEKAQKEILGQIGVYVKEDTLVGDIDGINTTFETSYYPIADTNFDLVVNNDDIIHMYSWGDRDSINTRATVGISTIYPEYGWIVLTSAPSSTIECVTATYYYYGKDVEPSVILENIPELTALLAGYKYIASEMLLLPEQWMHGAYRFKVGDSGEKLYSQYERLLHKLFTKESYKDTHDDMDSATRLRD